MDHVVYLDFKADELNKLISGQKRMIIRGASGRKLPYGRVEVGDKLYFINNNAEGLVKANAEVSSVFNSQKMNPVESKQLVESNQGKLALSSEQLKRWAGKRYIVLVEVKNMKEIPPFEIDKSDYGNMDDWIPVESIDLVKI